MQAFGLTEKITNKSESKKRSQQESVFEVTKMVDCVTHCSESRIKFLCRFVQQSRGADTFTGEEI